MVPTDEEVAGTGARTTMLQTTTSADSEESFNRSEMVRCHNGYGCRINYMW